MLSLPLLTRTDRVFGKQCTVKSGLGEVHPDRNRGTGQPNSAQNNTNLSFQIYSGTRTSIHMPIGPALPPHLAHLSGSGGGEDDEESRGNANGSDPNVPRARSSSPDEDDYGPALPPHLAAVRKGTVTAGPSRPALPLSPRRPVIDDDGDDDLIGPMPVASVGKEKSAVQEFMEREERKAKEREVCVGDILSKLTSAQDAAKPKKMQREEWMLVPPTSGVLASVDPLRKRPTTFSRSAAPVDTDNTVWTETPVEKAQRIADEVAGIKRKRLPKVGDGPDEEELAARRARDRQIRDGVEQHSVSLPELGQG